MFLLQSPENLGHQEDDQCDPGHCQAQNKPLQGRIDSIGADQAVCGQCPAGDGGEGKSRGRKDPGNGLRCRHIGVAQQADVLQPQCECLHGTADIRYATWTG